MAKKRAGILGALTDALLGVADATLDELKDSAPKRVERKQKPKPKPKRKPAKRAEKRPKKLQRYVPLKGTSRRYKDKRTGKTISKREYDAIRRAAGRRGKRVSNETYARERREAGTPNRLAKYNSILSDYEQSARLRGDKRSRDQIRRSADFRRMLDDLRSGDRRPGGRMARALERLGRRPPGADWWVGDTPRVRKGRR